MKKTDIVWNLMVVVVCGFSVVYCKRKKPLLDEIERIVNDTHSIIWPCPDCQFGLGLNPPCGTSVPFSLSIQCVECVEGVNYSDTHNHSSCKDCRNCAENEKTSGKCRREEDTTKCLNTCHNGFFWDTLTDSCQNCSDCCGENVKFHEKQCENSGHPITHQCRPTNIKCHKAHPTNASFDREQPLKNSLPKKTLLLSEIMAIVFGCLAAVVAVVVIFLVVMWKLCGCQAAKTLLRKIFFCWWWCIEISNGGNTTYFNNEVFDEHHTDPFTLREIHSEEVTDKIGSLKSGAPVVKRPGLLRLFSVPVQKTQPFKAKSKIPRSHSHPGCLMDLHNGQPKNKPTGTLKKCISDLRTKRRTKKGYILVATDADDLPVQEPSTEFPVVTDPDQCDISVVLQGQATAEREEKLSLLTIPPKDQSTSTSGLYCSSEINPLASVPQEFQRSLLRRKMANIPIEFYRKICIKLDTLRKCFWDDYRKLGEAIGLTKDEVLYLGQIGSPTDLMMQKFDCQKDSSIGKFKGIVEKMERNDVVTVIEEWVIHEWEKSNCSKVVIV